MLVHIARYKQFTNQVYAVGPFDGSNFNPCLMIYFKAYDLALSLKSYV